MKTMDEIVQRFAQMCTIEQHQMKNRPDPGDARVTYRNYVKDGFYFDDGFRSKQVIDDATQFLTKSINELTKMI